MEEEMTHLLRKFLAKFVKAKVTREASHVNEIDFANPENQLPDAILAVGSAAMTHMAEAEEDISPSAQTAFFREGTACKCWFM